MARTRAFTVGSLIPGIMTVHITPVPVQRQELETPIVKKQVSKIIIQQNGQKFEITPTQGSLLDAALDQGKSLQYKCRKGTCGQCKVKIVQGVGLSPANDLEVKKLGKDIGDGYRLACQAEILGSTF
jgi:ferredoxin, 2Fe-2S